MAKVLVAMGSKSDLNVVRPAVEILKKFGVQTEVVVMSAHRTPTLVQEYATGKRGEFDVFIGVAGKAAHLAGVIASYTTRPVIGLPVKSSTMDGLDSLLSTVQMPSGIPVATVAIDGGLNAGLLAVQILSVSDAKLKKSLEEYRLEQANKIQSDNLSLASELLNEKN